MLKDNIVEIASLDEEEDIDPPTEDDSPLPNIVHINSKGAKAPPQNLE